MVFLIVVGSVLVLYFCFLVIRDETKNTNYILIPSEDTDIHPIVHYIYSKFVNRRGEGYFADYKEHVLISCCNIEITKENDPIFKHIPAPILREFGLSGATSMDYINKELNYRDKHILCTIVKRITVDTSPLKLSKYEQRSF